MGPTEYIDTASRADLARLLYGLLHGSPQTQRDIKALVASETQHTFAPDVPEPSPGWDDDAGIDNDVQGALLGMQAWREREAGGDDLTGGAS